MVKQELIISLAREREREREHNVGQERGMALVCSTDGISALMAHLFQVTSEGDGFSHNNDTCERPSAAPDKDKCCAGRP